MHSVATTTTPRLRDTLSGILPAGAVRTNRAAPLDVGRLVQNTLLVAALLSLNRLGTPGSVVFFGILAVMMFRSPEAAFKALAICYVGLMINRAFVPKSLVWTPARLMLPYIALIRFAVDASAYRISLTGRRSYVCLLLFAAAMAVCSIASGWYTHIALLKLTNFVVFLTAIFAGTAVLRRRRSDIGEWFVSLILAATLFGIASIVLKQSQNFRTIVLGSGQVVANPGFNGAFLHPNAHATYATLFVTFLAIVWILSRYRHAWLTLPVIGCWLLFIAWSGSRTAFLASAVVIILLIAYARPIRNRMGWLLRPNVRRGTLVGVFGLATVLALAIDVGLEGPLRRSVVAFVNKGGSGENPYRLNTEKILSSRKALIDYSWQNFMANPAFGIGFGVAKTEDFQRNATLFTAPAEKGFLPSAILEEGGLLGTLAFLVFVVAFLSDQIRERNVAGLVTFLAFLATNLGEVTIFAPGGAGAFGWITVGAAMVLGDRCWSPPRVQPPDRAAAA